MTADAALAANKEVVRRFFETFSSGNVPAILDAIADDGGWWVSGRLNGMSGRYDKTSFGPLLAGATQLYRNGCLRIEPLTMLAEGDFVAVEARGRAELVDGRVYEPHYHFRIEVRGGRVQEVREYMDTQHAKEIFFA